MSIMTIYSLMVAGTRRSHFVDLEKEYLQVLPVALTASPLQKGQVQRTAHIFLSEDHNYYSVPYRFTGLSLKFSITQSCRKSFITTTGLPSIKGVTGQAITPLWPNHMPSTHRAYQQWSPQHFEDRAREVGSCTLEYIRKLLGQYSYPEVAYKQAQGILAFLKQYDRSRLENACKRCTTVP
jgi:hypothetical protein